MPAFLLLLVLLLGCLVSVCHAQPLPNTTDDFASGAFVFQRQELAKPSDPDLMFHVCVGGSGYLTQRLVSFASTSDYYDIQPYETWFDPPNDWADINTNVVDVRDLQSESINSGSVTICSCRLSPLSFTYMLLANSNRSYALDTYQSSGRAPPFSFGSKDEIPYDPNGPEADAVQELYSGNTSLDIGVGFTFISVLNDGETLVTKTKVVRLNILNEKEETIALRVYSSLRVYAFDIFLVPREDVEVGEKLVHLGKERPETTSTSDATAATVYLLDPPPSGYDYVIYVSNPHIIYVSNPYEEQVNIVFDEVLQRDRCEANIYLFRTQFKLTYSLRSCKEVECRGSRVDYTSSSSPSGGGGGWKNIYSRWLFLLAMACVF